MEDYHVAEYKYENDHELGLFAIYDGHLGDTVSSFLKANLFNNILKEVSFILFVFLFHPCKNMRGMLCIYEVLISTRCLYDIFVASPLDEPSRSNKKCIRLYKQIYSGKF
jgi:hypothetical protein